MQNFAMMRNVRQSVKQSMLAQKVDTGAIEMLPNGSLPPEGHVNPYEDPYMNITGKDPSEWQKIIPVSAAITKEMKVITLEAYMERCGMSGTGATADQQGQASQKYVKTIKGEDRLFATWTLQQISSSYAGEIVTKIREHNPNWKYGESFDTSILKGFQDELNKSLDIMV